MKKNILLISLLVVFATGCKSQTNKPDGVKYIVKMQSDKSVDPDGVAADNTFMVLLARLSRMDMEVDFKKLKKNEYEFAISTGLNEKAVQMVFTQPGYVGYYELYTPNELPDLAEKFLDSNWSAQTEYPALSEKVREYLTKRCRNPRGIFFEYLPENVVDDLKAYLKMSLPRDAWVVQSAPHYVSDQSSTNNLFILKTTPDSFIDQKYIVSSRYSEKPYEQIELVFNQAGAGLWADITEKSLDRHVAIVMDSLVVSVPVVANKIESGHANIIINQDEETIRVWNAILNAGPLQTTVTIEKKN